jgi:hypothetical protein
LFGNRQIPAKFCAIPPQNQIFFYQILAKFCGEMAQNFMLNSRKIFYQNPKKIDFVVIWHKILREFGRKLCDFGTTADHNFFRKINVFFNLSEKDSVIYGNFPILRTQGATRDRFWLKGLYTETTHLNGCRPRCLVILSKHVFK